MSIQTAGVRRRSVVRGAAWTAPAVMMVMAAPAHAATSNPCAPLTQTIDWGSLNWVSATRTAGTYTVSDPDGSGIRQGLTLSVQTLLMGSNTRTGDQRRQVDDNLRVSSYPVGGTNDSGLTLHQSPINDYAKSSSLSDANRSVTRFVFSRPVTDLRFTICDIDSAAADFRDAIAITGTGFTHAIADGRWVRGTGSTNDPFRSRGSDDPVPDTSRVGNVTVTMPAVTSFDLHYWNISGVGDDTIDGDQRTFLSDFTFAYAPC